MPALRRAELHLQVAEALERVHAADEGRGGLAELAYHFGEAAAVDGPRRAIDYSLLAGRAALRRSTSMRLTCASHTRSSSESTTRAAAPGRSSNSGPPASGQATPTRR